MPKVPTYNPGSVRESGLPGVRYSGGANENTFGSTTGRMIQAVGKAGEKLGMAMYQKLLSEQKKSDLTNDKSVVRDRYRQASSEIRTYLNEDVYRRKGENATKVYGEVEQKINEIRKKYLKDLTEERQKDLFTASFDSLSEGHLNRAMSFQEKSRKAYEKMTMNAENQDAIENAIAARLDPNEIQTSEQTIIANTRYANKGMGDKITNKAVEDAVHNLHASVLSAVTKDSPEAGMGYLKSNWDKFNPKLREEMKKDLQDQAKNEWVRGKAVELSALPIDKALAEVDKIKDADDAAKVRRMVKDRYKEQEDVKKIKHKERLEKEVDAVFTDPVKYEVPLELPAKDQEHLYNLRQRMLKDEKARRGVGGATKTDPKTYYELMNMEPDKFKQLNLLEYSDRLSIGDFKSLTKMQKKDEDFKNAQTLTTFVNQFVKNETEDDFEKAAFVREMFENELNKYPRDQRDKIETWNKVKDQMLMEVDVKGSIFDTSYWDAKYDKSEIEAPDEIPEGIPNGAKWVDKMIDGQIYRGFEFTNPEGVTFLYSTDGNTYRVN